MHRIDRYLFSQMLFPFTLNIVFFTFLFLITQVLEIADLVVNYRIGLGSVGWLMACAAPFFLQFTIPMAVMVTVLVTFLRLSGDREILALKAGGYSIWRLLPPVAAFCLLAAFLTALMTLYGLPWGKLESRRVITELALQHGDMALKPMVFNDMFSGVTLYVGEMDRNSGKLKDIFVEDFREGGMGTVLAPEGRLHMDAAAGLARLQLSQGMILRGSGAENTEVHAISFENYELTLDLSREKGLALARKSKDKEEMGFNELRAYIRTLPENSKSYNAAVMKFHEKFSLPAACLALGLLAFPLGVNTLERRRASGIGNGLLYFLMYYMLLTMGWSFGESGVYPPGLAMWTPNGVTTVAGFWLLSRVAAEKPLMPRTLWAGRQRGWKR
ncbi:LPS export ABC transporter permease LptF [Desulfobotulus sp.]|uniref:LPS export ABC transporter permease LptF n=1 Tax=Desulfobotulus sp. TaxID=1940337 RepID=UPI002A35C5EB|nr:LPS export ABC transporter permease LptF [Desulfobotulus sp.]MDY0162407.1 LPS export ABC transporter permease LptF [Desulfobotulus sp.]